jgi:hypothetical protein
LRPVSLDSFDRSLTLPLFLLMLYVDGCNEFDRFKR